MFNFSKFKISKESSFDDYTPFVGIRRTKDGQFEFKLPTGFKDFPSGDFYEIKNLFFLMYRTFKKFEKQNKNNILDTQPKQKDNLNTLNKAYKFKDKNDEDILLYSKIDIIDKIIDSYDDLRISTLSRITGNTESINFNKIDQYLDHAVYIDDIIYIENYENLKPIINLDIHNILEIYAFILFEIKKELNESVNDQIILYHSFFREKYLGYEDSLFNDLTFEKTISILKETLDKIEKNTSYKDDDYWNIYNAVEIFLYGELNTDNISEDGIFWGVNNFYQIWEDMCNTYAFKKYKNILYCDTNITINNKKLANKRVGGRLLYCSENFAPNFHLSLKNNYRHARPDLIYELIEEENITEIDQKGISIEVKERKFNVVDIDIRLSNSKNSNYYQKIIDSLNKKLKGHAFRFKPPGKFYTVPRHLVKNLIDKKISTKTIRLIDWKYVSLDFFYHKSSQKLKTDIIKQLFYEFILKENFDIIENIFTIPTYFKTKGLVGTYLSNDNELNEFLKNSKISIFQINFHLVQKAYLEND